MEGAIWTISYYYLNNIPICFQHWRQRHAATGAKKRCNANVFLANCCDPSRSMLGFRWAIIWSHNRQQTSQLWSSIVGQSQSIEMDSCSFVRSLARTHAREDMPVFIRPFLLLLLFRSISVGPDLLINPLIQLTLTFQLFVCRCCYCRFGSAIDEHGGENRWAANSWMDSPLHWHHCRRCTPPIRHQPRTRTYWQLHKRTRTILTAPRKVSVHRSMRLLMWTDCEHIMGQIVQMRNPYIWWWILIRQNCAIDWEMNKSIDAREIAIIDVWSVHNVTLWTRIMNYHHHHHHHPNI